jgi:uncharacterized membrane protein HdeD (DUF308 family)
MSSVFIEIENPRESAPTKWWWLPLVAGILWILVGLFVLQADYDSAVLIGYLVAFWLIFAGVAEFMEVAIVEGWKWLHLVMGVVFVIGGVLALLAPFQTFTVLAALIGIFLVVKGAFDFFFGIMLRRAADLWWITMTAGILQIVLGIWAMGYPGRSAALLILWIGIGAVIRGIVEIVASFHLRKGPEMMVVAV